MVVVLRRCGGDLQEPWLGDTLELRHHGLSPVGTSPKVPAIADGSARVAEQDRGAGAEQKSHPLHAEQEGWASASSPSALRLSRADPAGVVALPGRGHFPRPHPGLCWM